MFQLTRSNAGSYIKFSHSERKSVHSVLKNHHRIVKQTDLGYPKFIWYPQLNHWWVVEAPDRWVEYQPLGKRWQRYEIQAVAYLEKVRLADALAAAEDSAVTHAVHVDALAFADALSGSDCVGDAFLPGQTTQAPTPLSTPHPDIATTFAVPATAAAEWTVRTDGEVRSVLTQARATQTPVLPLGGGSNVLFTAPWPGWILRLAIGGIEVLADDGDAVEVVAGAGVVWHDFVLHTLDAGWGGLENLALIPGSVGASPMQNIGAYGTEIQDRFLWLDAISREDGRLRRFHPADCAFGYRESVFKTTERDRWIIVRVAFRLERSAPVSVSYGALESTLLEAGHRPPFTRRQVADAVIAVRRSKLPDPAVLGNAGSFFKNPVVSAAQHKVLREAHPDIAAYPLPDGTVKLAAGWLIDRAGWKGHDRGTHGVHDRQALVLVNRGGARGEEVWQLSAEIQEDVRARFGVELEREVNRVP